ncbi:FAD-dependent oxidoreductase [Candidatus Peregrinibacteria bacterium]|nr:FAD-dependent oxidoreductase [Candidatus Peregrinibacteria bacterium]
MLSVKPKPLITRCDVLIIGMGPAGLSAGMYTARAGLSTVIFGFKEKGHLYQAKVISNYFGAEDVAGRMLIEKGIKQALRFSAVLHEKEIVSLGIAGEGGLSVKDSSGEVFIGKFVIIATGTSYAVSGIKHEEIFLGKGVSHCAICDGFFFKEKKIAVIGNGNYAASEAIELRSFSPHVTMMSHGKDFEISSSIAEEIATRGVTMRKTPKIREFSGKDRLSELLFEDGTTENVDAAFLAIGTAGAFNFAQTLGLELSGNYIKVNVAMETNVTGIYAAGNCTGADPQAAVSVGEGCRAALSIIRKVRGAKVYLQYN